MQILKWLWAFYLAFIFSMAQAKDYPVSLQYVGPNNDSNFSAALQSSIGKIIDFSAKYDLGPTKAEDFVSKVVIYASKSEFDSMLRSSPDWPKNAQVPKTFVGVGEKKVFHVVSWPAYQTVHPDETYSDYQKLIAHELGHLFHIAYLHGQEDKMGPVWFYEGFACLIADQYPDSPLPSKSEVTSILKDPKRGNYKTYAPIMRALARLKPIKEMLNHASDSGFSKEMSKLLENVQAR